MNVEAIIYRTIDKRYQGMLVLETENGDMVHAQSHDLAVGEISWMILDRFSESQTAQGKPSKRFQEYRDEYRANPRNFLSTTFPVRDARGLHIYNLHVHDFTHKNSF